jgi:hypothetical protein
MANKACGKTCRLHLLKGTLAARIGANGTDKANLMPKGMGMEGEVEGRTAQVFDFRENVPQDFAHAYDFHAHQ